MSKAKTGNTSSSKVDAPSVDAKAAAKKAASVTAKTAMSILVALGTAGEAQQKLREEETIAHMRGQRHNSSYCALCKEGK